MLLLLMLLFRFYAVFDADIVAVAPRTLFRNDGPDLFIFVLFCRHPIVTSALSLAAITSLLLLLSPPLVQQEELLKSVTRTTFPFFSGLLGGRNLMFAWDGQRESAAGGGSDSGSGDGSGGVDRFGGSVAGGGGDGGKLVCRRVLCRYLWAMMGLARLSPAVRMRAQLVVSFDFLRLDICVLEIVPGSVLQALVLTP